MIYLVLIMHWPTKQEEEFLNLCEEGDVESVKTLLAKDPSLINSENEYGKL